MIVWSKEPHCSSERKKSVLQSISLVIKREGLICTSKKRYIPTHWLVTHQFNQRSQQSPFSSLYNCPQKDNISPLPTIFSRLGTSTFNTIVEMGFLALWRKQEQLFLAKRRDREKLEDFFPNVAPCYPISPQILKSLHSYDHYQRRGKSKGSNLIEVVISTYQVLSSPSLS